VTSGTATLAATPLRSRAWAVVGALSVTETVSWGILYYAFAAFLLPMQHDLGFSTSELTGAFSVGLLVSAAGGIAVGRYLDRHGPRGLMTAGSVAGVLLVLAWSQVDGLVAFYAIWVGIGLVLSAVLYEPAFVVLAKHFPRPNERRRAMTALTLAGALASFIFVPLAQTLIDGHGWRDALVMLAVILAVITVPLHAGVLREAPPAPVRVAHVPARDAFASVAFWLVSAAFVLGSIASIAMTVHTIPFLVERGHSASFAAFAVGVIGVAQIPGRVVFAVIANRAPAAVIEALPFGLIATGIGIVAAGAGQAVVLFGLMVLGMGNGMTTLARATILADRYGSGAYGTIAGVAAATTTTARALGPIGAAVLAAALGYVAVLWLLVGMALLAAGFLRRSA
jgi:MFS family permease